MAERSFKRSPAIAHRRGRRVPRRGHPRGHQGPAAVRRGLCGRLPGFAHLAPDGRAGRRQRDPAGTRRALRGQRLGSHRRRHAGGLGHVSDPWRRHLEIHGRHQRRLGRAGQPGIRRRHRRRAGDRGRGLRRRLVHHAGTLARVRHEIADLAAGPAPQSGKHGQGGGRRLFAVRGQQDAGDAAAAHPRLPRARPLHRQGKQAPRLQPGAGAGKPGARHQPHRAAAASFLHEQEKIRTAGPPPSAISRNTSSTSISTATSPTSA